MGPVRQAVSKRTCPLALENLRLRIARDLHDEVSANPGGISLLTQMMERTPPSTDDVQVRGLAVQTMNTLHDIVWFIGQPHSAAESTSNQSVFPSFPCFTDKNLRTHQYAGLRQQTPRPALLQGFQQLVQRVAADEIAAGFAHESVLSTGANPLS
jgi:hypothetical protein